MKRLNRIISTTCRRNLKYLAGDRSFHTACTVILVFAFITVLYPFIYTISCSFSETDAIIQGRVMLWPINPTIEAYRRVFNHPMLMTGFLNSVFYVAGGTFVGVFLVLTAAYPLSRKDLPGRKLFLSFFVVTMFFSGGLIPSYILMNSLHLVGSRWALIVGVGFSCYNMIIVKSYFQNTIPSGLLDAAHIDGCRDLLFFTKIALPLSTPVIAVMILFNATGIWNGFFSGMMYLTKSNTFNFQMILRDILFVAQMPPEMLADLDQVNLMNWQSIFQQIRYSVLVVGALPMMILYPFIQKYFIKGMMIGSLKE
jgi:multiple sugar transport system permease protein/putative aldouronate transport system permease protein